ncbi:MAG: RND transporter [Pseudopelagicola sp.]|nr:RND transporter [Pseudopelagicola sp.]
MKWLDRVSWFNLVLVALLLGLAPFSPEPHLWEKLKMLAAGSLVRPLDWFDLALHGAPFLVLALKGVRHVRKTGA